MKPKGIIPDGAVILDEQSNYVPRSGSERVQQGENIIDPETGDSFECFVIWPSNRNSKASPEHGPFTGQHQGKTYFYFTHVLPDKDGVFTPARYDIYPPLLAERIDAQQERQAALPAWLKTAIKQQLGR